MDPYRPPQSRPSLARSPTLRPNPHHRLADANTDEVIKFVRDFQKGPDMGSSLYPQQDSQSALSPSICRRKNVLPAIGVSSNIPGTDDYTTDGRNVVNTFGESVSIVINPALPDEKAPGSIGSDHNGKVRDSSCSDQEDIAVDSFSANESNHADMNMSRLGQYIIRESSNTNDNSTSITDRCDEFDHSGKACAELSVSGCNDYLMPSCEYPQHDGYLYNEPQLEPSPGSERRRNKPRNGRVGGVEGARLHSRNSLAVQDEEVRFGDDSMLQPVSHQSVVAEDKLVSSRCRRSSKLLEKLMLSDYNTGQSASLSSSFTSHGSNGGNSSKASRRFTNSVLIAGQLLRPKALPQLPPILKRQRTMEQPPLSHPKLSLEPSHPLQLRERPSAPSPSLTPPSPHSQDDSEFDDSQLTDEPPIDFIDCR